jgi:hypothetical protein
MRSSRTLRAMAARRRRAVIRGSLIALVAVATLISAAGPVEARSLRIRHDPNEATHEEPDIRRVVSDLSTSTVYLRIDTWQILRHRDGYIASVLFDSSGNRNWDRQLEIFRGKHGYRCRLQRGDGGGTPVVGERRATRPLQRSVACPLPRSWFPRIHRAVRFYAQTLNYDRAPNRGVYLWL